MTGDQSKTSALARSGLMRRYRVRHLRADGTVAAMTHLAPALAAFDDAFCALGRGTILQKPDGPVAVEDLTPGDHVRCSDGQFVQVLWHGTVTLPAQPMTEQGLTRLTRISAHTLGFGLPMQDLILGPAARLPRHTDRATRQTAAQIPASDFVDGENFIALRPTYEVDLHQLGFAGHEIMLANGIGVASLHLGSTFSLGLRGNLLAQYCALFPHLR